MGIGYQMKTFFLFILFYSENRGMYVAVNDYLYQLSSLIAAYYVISVLPFNAQAKTRVY